MIVGRAQPDGHLAIRIKLDIAEAEYRGFVIKFLRNALDERGKVERDHVHLDAKLPEILLHHNCHAFSRFVTRIGHDGELDGMAPNIE